MIKPSCEAGPYNLAYWGEGYFCVDNNGHLCVSAGLGAAHRVSLDSIIKQAQAQGLRLPLLMRFPDILQHKIACLNEAFLNAMQTCGYRGRYLCAYPIKVNQQHALLSEMMCTPDYPLGLEAGSKAELMVVLALQTAPSVILCNGYKDNDYIHLALIGQQMGHSVTIIIEKLSEIPLIIKMAEKLVIKPRLGIRVRLLSIGNGQWQNTGGEKAKFGLTSGQVLTAIKMLEECDLLDCLHLLHFHMGSQLANIRDIQKGLQEGAQFYRALRLANAPIEIVDVGGGVGIDYEGTKTRSDFSVNYSLEEYALNVVRVFQECCLKDNLPHPMLITEAGRAMVAHHAVLITNTIGVEHQAAVYDDKTQTLTHPLTQDLNRLYQQFSEKSLLETYHDTVYLLSEVQVLFTHGLLSLLERAQAEDLSLAIMHKVKALLDSNVQAHREVLDELNEKLASKYFCNFSLFQSVPDIWGLRQTFPIMPLSRLNETLVSQGIVQDLTCDSDGRIDSYVSTQGVHNTLALPAYDESKPYYLGVFLVGAYQEILGDIHNLFGQTDAVNVILEGEGGYQLTHAKAGALVQDVLLKVGYNAQDLLQIYQDKLETAKISVSERHLSCEFLAKSLESYTYFEDVL